MVIMRMYGHVQMYKVVRDINSISTVFLSSLFIHKRNFFFWLISKSNDEIVIQKMALSALHWSIRQHILRDN